MRDGSYRDKNANSNLERRMEDPAGSRGKGEVRVLPSALRGCPGGRAEGRLKVLPKCFCEGTLKGRLQLDEGQGGEHIPVPV